MKDNKKISILTKPMPIGKFLIIENLRNIGRFFKRLINPPKFNYGIYGGHYAVTRSLIVGLKKNGYPHNYNPKTLSKLSETVVVLAGVRTLSQAIKLKRLGYIKKLFAGPNIVIFSADNKSILASTEIDAVITPSNYINDLYIEDNKCLHGKIFSWPAGVNTDYWKPDLSLKRDTVLVFEKQNKGPVGPIEPYTEHLLNMGWKVEVMRYGSFSHDKYRAALQHACLMIGFVTDESQGIAWAEAWSCDVPTLIWRNTSNIYNGRHYKCSTAPYLCEDNGLFFDDLEHFKEQFAYWQNQTNLFQPRHWTLENMSDEICSKQLYTKVITC